MKKINRIVLVTLCCLLMGSVNAQEVKNNAATSKYQLGFTFGMESLPNYPALSLFKEDVAKYSFFTEGIFAKINGGDMYWGLQYLVSTPDLSNLDNTNQEMMYHRIEIMMSPYKYVSKNVELYSDLHIGLGILHNSFNSFGKGYSFNRYAFTGGLDVGINYNFTDRGFIGIKGGFPIGYILSDKPELPNMLVNTDRSYLYGYNIMIIWGARL